MRIKSEKKLFDTWYFTSFTKLTTTRKRIVWIINDMLCGWKFVHFKWLLLLLLLYWVHVVILRRRNEKAAATVSDSFDSFTGAGRQKRSTWNNNKGRKLGMKNELHLTHPMNIKGNEWKRRRRKRLQRNNLSYFLPASFLILFFNFYKLCIYFIFTVSFLLFYFRTHTLYNFLFFISCPYRFPSNSSLRQVESVQ